MSAAPAGVVSEILERCGARPKAVALRVKRLGIWEETSAEELASRVLRLSSALSSLGARGRRVAMLADGSPATLAIDLAAQHAGASSLWCYPTRSAAEVGELLARCDPAVVVCADEEQLAKLVRSGLALDGVRIVVEELRRLPSAARASVLGVDDLELLAGTPGAGSVPAGAPGEAAATACAVTVSAGTAGSPRAIEVPAPAQLAAMAALAEAVGLGARDRVLQCVPLAQPAARTLAYASLAIGAVLHFPESPETIPENFVEVVPTVLFGPPRLLDLLRREDTVRAARSSRPTRALHRAAVSVLSRVAERREREAARPADPVWRALASLFVGLPLRKRLGLAGARCVLIGGGAAPVESVRFFTALGVGVRPLYGLAESCGVGALAAEGAPLGPLVLLAGYQARLSGGGELELSGRGVVAPGAGSGWLATGDLATLGGEGGRLLSVLGRAGETVPAAGGAGVPVAAVSEVLRRSPYVDLVAVFSSPAEAGALAVLVQPERELLAEWARRRGLHQSSYAALVAEPEVRRLIAGELGQVAAQLPGGLRLGTSELLPRPLDEQEGELSPARQVRLDAVRAHFGHLVGLAAPGAAGPGAAGSGAPTQVPVTQVSVPVVAPPPAGQPAAL